MFHVCECLTHRNEYVQAKSIAANTHSTSLIGVWENSGNWLMIFEVNTDVVG